MTCLKWDSFPGRLRSVSVASKSNIWGVTLDLQLCKLNPDTLQWQLVSVNSEDAIHPRSKTKASQDSDYTFQVSAANDGTVVRLDKTLKTRYLIGSQNRKDFENNIIWIDLGHVWKCVSVASVSQIWGLSDNGDIYYGASDRFVLLKSPVTSGAGYNMPKFTHISVGQDNLVVATDALTGTVFRLKTHPTSSHPPVWSAVDGTGPGAAIHMTSCSVSSAEFIIGLSSDGRVFRRCNGNWIPISGQTKLSCVDIGVDGYIMGVDMEGNLHTCQLQNSAPIPLRLSSRNSEDSNPSHTPKTPIGYIPPRHSYLSSRITSSRDLFELESTGGSSYGHSSSTSGELSDVPLDGEFSSGHNTPARYTFGRTDSQISKNSYATDIGPLTPMTPLTPLSGISLGQIPRGESISRNLSNRLTPLRIQPVKAYSIGSGLSESPIDYISSKPLPGGGEFSSPPVQRGTPGSLLSLVRGELNDNEKVGPPLSVDGTISGRNNLKQEALENDDHLRSKGQTVYDTRERSTEKQEVEDSNVERSRENSVTSNSGIIKKFPTGEESIAEVASPTTAAPHIVSQGVERLTDKDQDNQQNGVSHEAESEPDPSFLAPGLMAHRPSNASSDRIMQQQQEFLRQTRLRSDSLAAELNLKDLAIPMLGNNGRSLSTPITEDSPHGYPPLEDPPMKRSESIESSPDVLRSENSGANSSARINSKSEVPGGDYFTNNNNTGSNNNYNRGGIYVNSPNGSNSPYGHNPNSFGTPNGNNPGSPYGGNPYNRNSSNNVLNGSPNIRPVGNNGSYGSNPNIGGGPNTRTVVPYGWNPNIRPGSSGDNVNSGPYGWNPNIRPESSRNNTNNGPYGGNPRINSNGPYGGNPYVSNGSGYNRNNSNNSNSNAQLGANPNAGSGVYSKYPSSNHGGAYGNNPNSPGGPYDSNPNGFPGRGVSQFNGAGGDAYSRNPYFNNSSVQQNVNYNSNNPFELINGNNDFNNNNNIGSKTELTPSRIRDSAMTTSTAYSLEPVNGNSGLVSRHGGAYGANSETETLGRPSQQTLRTEARPSGEGYNSSAKPKAQIQDQGTVQGEDTQGEWVGGNTSTNTPVQYFTPDVKKSKCCTIM